MGEAAGCPAHLMADALVTQLDKLDWAIPYQPFTIHSQDPLEM